MGVETVLFWSDFKAVSSACFNQAYGGFPSCIKGLFLALIFPILCPRRRKKVTQFVKECSVCLFFRITRLIKRENNKPSPECAAQINFLGIMRDTYKRQLLIW